MIALFLTLVIVSLCYVNIKKDLREIKEFNLETRKWLFDSLYSINHNVKLPEDKKEVEVKEAVVINPRLDPYSEFNGNKDDWH